MKTVAALALVAFAGVASAAETLNLGSFLQTDSVRNQNISGLLSGSGYTRVQVSVNWTTASGGAWSDEALWALADNDITNAVDFYADPGAAGNSASSTAPVTLTWSAYTSKKINASTPLWFLSLQTYAPSSANWGNVRVTFDDAAATAPSGAINLGDVATTSDIFNLGLEASDFDTEIGLYNAWGGLLANDDDSGTGFTSLLTGLQLDEGTYYVAVGGYNTAFSTAFGVTPGTDFGSIGGLVNGTTFSGTLAEGGVQWYSFNVVPTPGAISVLALGGVIAGRRRRN